MGMNDRFERWTGGIDIFGGVLLLIIGLGMTVIVMCSVIALVGAVVGYTTREERGIKQQQALEKYISIEAQNGLSLDEVMDKLIKCDRMYQTPIGRLTCPQDELLYGLY